MIRLKIGDLVTKDGFVGVVSWTGEQELGGYAVWYPVQVDWIDHKPKSQTFEGIKQWPWDCTIEPITKQEAQKLIPDSHIGRENWVPIEKEIK